MHKFIGILLSLFLISSSFARPYAGISGGYGMTTWKGLIPPPDKQNFAIMISTPLEVDEGGGMWGALVGFEFTPHFAIEGSYKHFPSHNRAQN